MRNEVGTSQRAALCVYSTRSVDGPEVSARRLPRASVAQCQWKHERIKVWLAAGNACAHAGLRQFLRSESHQFGNYLL